MFDNYLDKASVELMHSLGKEVHLLLKDLKLKIATSESLTSGALAASLTKYPGSSGYFLGGVVCYDTVLKVKLGGVNVSTIQQFGAVSQETALEMVNGIVRLTNCDIGISTTGIAGPPNQEFSIDDIGTVHIGFHVSDRQMVKSFQFKGTRPQIIDATVHAALSFLKSYVSQKLT